ncbi:MAG: diguanylate cyclase [Betaproteobacteria bacterium]|nr:diguanylate cyclase [Betaproteobacteria bacterium]
MPVLINALIAGLALGAGASAALWFLYLRPLRDRLTTELANARVIVDTASQGIVTIDEHGSILLFNRAAQRMFGYSLAEALGQNVSLLMPAPEREHHDGYLQRYRHTHEKHVIDKTREVTGLRRSGETFPIELSISAVEAGGRLLFSAILHDITERKRLEERIRHMAHYDELTDLPNRALFYDRLKQAIALARRQGDRIALIYLDLDRFKPVNDHYGHHTGDLLLKAVAQRLRAGVRESDTLARLGGDEFAVLLQSVNSLRDVAAVAEKLSDSFSAPFPIDDLMISIGASLGTSIFPDEADHADGLVKVADQAMYLAKARQQAMVAEVDDAYYHASHDPSQAE